ncbi:MAG TPA: PepSY domain-containing protein [Aequorivita sp.]|nr:PepSY domain-containing protein [Aequorivita sp.]
MTISLWRYSHLILALTSSLFLLVASVTGVILAFEPISHQTKGYAVTNLEEVSLATAIGGLKENYVEIFSLEVESSGFVKASVLTEDFETQNIYVNPKTGEELGEVIKRPEIYTFATNLHRSLFLKSIGRFFVGLVSFLLFLIAVTGIFLLAKRQGGIKKIFSKVRKEYFEMRYHVILSRLFFIPITIVALTGVYLSAEKFELLPDASVEYIDNLAAIETLIYKNATEIPFLKETKLSDVRKVDFPFSDDPEDYFHIALNNKEIQLNQQTGTIVSSASYPFIALASRFSWVLHTGEGNVFWSIILILASGSIVFFTYSGFVMTLKRRKKVLVNFEMTNKDESEYIILVGSETGTTFDCARRLYNALTISGKKVFLTELNHYSTYAKAKHLLILTATYGEGESPTNARKFESLFKSISQPNKISYSVVGFGSLEYPNYCEFAIEVDSLLQMKEESKAVLPLYKIDDSDFTDFQKWAKKWSAQTGVPIKIEPPKQAKKLKQITFEVTERTPLNCDDTFLLRLKPKQNVKFTSGDLLSVVPQGSAVARQYSIAKLGDEILLSIKNHKSGKASSYLFALKKGDLFNAAIEVNPNFHFPEGIPSAILIANGTGIAPFLGMIEKSKNIPIKLFWGGRLKESPEIYHSILDNSVLPKTRVVFHTCFSREENSQYVQDLVFQHSGSILDTLTNYGTIMICGSLTMQHGVLEILDGLLKKNTNLTLDTIINNGQLKMDCY